MDKRQRDVTHRCLAATLLAALLAAGSTAPDLAVPSAAVAKSMTLATSRPAGDIVLGDTPVRVPLDVSPPGPSATTRIQEAARDHRIYLVLSGLKARQPPGVLYDVYLEPTHQYVGTINFFSAVAPGGAEGSVSPTFSFDVTDHLKALPPGQSSASPLAVTIVPSGTPQTNAQAVIGTVALVAE
jgi:hypothetical protein